MQKIAIESSLKKKKKRKENIEKIIIEIFLKKKKKAEYGKCHL